MQNTINQSIEQLSREKSIDPQLVREALEDAMVAAAKRYFRTDEDLQARYDTETSSIEVFAVKRIVEEVEDDQREMSLKQALEVDETFEVGEYIEIPKPTLELGRIAAQTAKQVIFQKVLTGSIRYILRVTKGSRGSRAGPKGSCQNMKQFWSEL